MHRRGEAHPLCTPVAPPLGPVDLAHLHFRSTELSSSQRQEQQLYSDALWGATNGWCAACGSRLSSVGVIYDIVHAARCDGRAMSELAFKPRRDARNVVLRSQMPESPERPSDRRRAWWPIGRVGSARASEQSLAMHVRKSERFTILITRQEVTDGRTRSAALLV